jgi:ribosomal protein L11
LHGFLRADQGQGWHTLPVVLSVFEDKKFDFIIKTPAVLGSPQRAPILQGFGTAGKEEDGTVTKKSRRGDRQAEAGRFEYDGLEVAKKTVAGTARTWA